METIGGLCRIVEGNAERTRQQREGGVPTTSVQRDWGGAAGNPIKACGDLI